MSDEGETRRSGRSSKRTKEVRTSYAEMDYEEEEPVRKRPARNATKAVRYGDEDEEEEDMRRNKSKAKQPKSKASRKQQADDEDDDEEGEDDEEAEEYVNDDEHDDGGRGKLGKAHQLKYSECEEATEEGEKYLSKYVSVFEPFITAKVHQKLKHLHDMIVRSKKLLDVYHYDEVEPIGQPSTLVNCTLRDYQLDGISWMVDRYDKAINVILADEMGLGKTLQTIAFIAHLVHVRGLKGPHLVVVPLSVLFNWVQELKKWCPLLKFVRLHSNDSAEQERLKALIKDATQTEVVLTTYETIKSVKMSSTLRKMVWRSVILDEGHKLKNEDSVIHNAARMLRARFRLILTGTPVQNNLHETYALLSYLAPNIFKDSMTFDNAFDLNTNGNRTIQVDRDMLSKAHYMLRPFILRRLKSEVEKALPIKLETKILCPMTEMQRFWIKSLLLKEKDALAKVESVGGDALNPAGSDWRKLNSLMAQLRKAANHPYLFEGAEPPSLDGRAGEDIITASGKMLVLDRLLSKLKERGHRVVLFSQYTRTLDIISDYLVYRGYDATCRLDGQTNRVMREVYINMFNKKDSKKFIFLLSTRAGGEGVNLFTADTVILFDSDWNPQVDIQAMARVHRIGQTKPVHVYRLVSAGSVEERIVQRAQKKLFLDSMVNRGSTANAKLIDEQMQAAGDEDEKEQQDVEPSKILSALKFGWNSIFSVDKASQELSDADLDLILDRKRGVSIPSEIGAGAAGGSALMEGIQSTVDDFDETAAMVSIRELEGEEIPKVEGSTSVKAISASWRQFMLPDGAKRARKQRTYEVQVEGVGAVQVLNADNYSLDQGEPSVFGKEVAAKPVAVKPVQAFVPSSGRQVAGRDYGHQDFCLECWDGGELLLCDICPAGYHLECIGLTTTPTSMQWQCPHHTCCKCLRKSSAAGLLFRCECCPSAYCEDCLPSEHTVTGDSERLNQLGFRLPGSACYILCRQDCIDLYYHLSKREGVELVPMRRKISDAVQKKLHNVSKMSIATSSRVELPGEEVSNRLDDSADLARAVGMCQLGDAQIRLLRNNSARFTSLSELNGFEVRWRQASPHTKTILLILMSSVQTQFESAEDGEDPDAALRYKGAPMDASNSAIYKAFLNTTRRLTEVHKSKIVEMCRIIGISIISVLKRAPKDSALPPSSIEPKFKQVEDHMPRRCLEECLAAFLVLPHPQNLILAPALAEDKSCSNCPDLPLPLGSTMYVARLVEALGDRLLDLNKKFFTALSVRDGDASSFLQGWSDVYLHGTPLVLSQVRELLAPVQRLHFLQKDAIPRTVRILLDAHLAPGNPGKGKKSSNSNSLVPPRGDYEEPRAEDDSDPMSPGLLKKKGKKKFPRAPLIPNAQSLPASNFLNPFSSQHYPPLPGISRAPRVLPTIGGILQLEDFSKVSHLLHEWVSPIKQVPPSTSGFIIQVHNLFMADWAIGRLAVEHIRATFTPYEGLHSRMRYPKFALQLHHGASPGLSGPGTLVPIDEHVELVFILMFKFFALDFRVKNVVDLALDKAQEEGYLAPNESILSPGIVSVMRNAECFRKLFGVVIEKMKLNIKNRIQNLGEGPTVWLHGETILQLRETITDTGGPIPLREGQWSSYKSAGPGINFRCSQTVIEAISCSLGQYSLRHETKHGFSSDYVKQTTPNQEAIVLALLKWYFTMSASENPDGKPWDEWVGEEARKIQPSVEADRGLMERNRELCAFLSGCRKRYFSMNPLISNNEYMT